MEAFNLESTLQKKKIEIKIDAFEGPLDLLLALISKEEVDIYDIPIVKITDQYLSAVSELPKMDLDFTCEFLVMAATLLEIKSKMLLPEKDLYSSTHDIEPYDPREELVKRLLAYKIFKDAAKVLSSLEGQLDEVVFKNQEELSPYTKTLSNEMLNDSLESSLLSEAVKRVLMRIERYDENRKNFFKKIKRDQFTVEEKIQFIESHLINNDNIMFSHLFNESKTKEEVVVTFLALLELLKLKKVSIQQVGLFEEIFITKKTENDIEEGQESELN